MMEEEKWTLVIVPKTGFFKLDLGELWRYRDLLVMYIRRDIVTFYKQTILGPLWFILQPLFTVLMFMFVFGGIAPQVHPNPHLHIVHLFFSLDNR